MEYLYSAPSLYLLRGAPCAGMYGIEYRCERKCSVRLQNEAQWAEQVTSGGLTHTPGTIQLTVDMDVQNLWTRLRR